MFLLAAGAGCFSDSYDPNPWDDTPPVVTVDFNFVKPQAVSTQAFHEKTQRVAIGASDLHSARVSREPGMVAACAIISNKAQPGFSLFSPLRT